MWNGLRGSGAQSLAVGAQLLGTGAQPPGGDEQSRGVGEQVRGGGEQVRESGARSLGRSGQVRAIFARPRGGSAHGVGGGGVLASGRRPRSLLRICEDPYNPANMQIVGTPSASRFTKAGLLLGHTYWFEVRRRAAAMCSGRGAIRPRARWGKRAADPQPRRARKQNDSRRGVRLLSLAVMNFTA